MPPRRNQPTYRRVPGYDDFRRYPSRSPEIRRTVHARKKATLLLPAGVTSLASIYYKDEAELLDGAEDTDKVYVDKILPAKMYYNLKAIERFGFWRDIKTMFMTVFAVLGKEYNGDYVPPEETAEGVIFAPTESDRTTEPPSAESPESAQNADTVTENRDAEESPDFVANHQENDPE